MIGEVSCCTKFAPRQVNIALACSASFVRSNDEVSKATLIHCPPQPYFNAPVRISIFLFLRYWILNVVFTMADPLTVAIGVASLVAAAGKSLQSIQNFRTKYKSSDLSALTLKAQCDCILVALGQIQTTLLSKQRLAARLISDESVSGQSLKSVLGACEVTFVIMVDKLSKLNRNFESIPNGISTKDKIARVWNESKINELGQNISRLSDGLNLMLTAFNT